MNQKSYHTLLFETLKNLENIEKWLQRSYEICQKIGAKSTYTPEEFDAFEVLTSRYARMTDFIINKVIRTIDRVEFEYQSGALIDILNRAHKKGLIESVDELRGIKELRNVIAHEYTNPELGSVFQAVVATTPKLFILAKKINDYCKKF